MDHSGLRLGQDNPLGVKPCHGGLGAWHESSSHGDCPKQQDQRRLRPPQWAHVCVWEEGGTEIAAAGFLPQGRRDTGDLPPSVQEEMQASLPLRPRGHGISTN